MAGYPLSIVVPTYNRHDSLRRLLLSLRPQTFPASDFEVVVADTGSTDATHELVTTFACPYALRYVGLEKRNVFDAPVARNAGARAASGELLVFLDSDMIVDRQFVAEHARSHAEQPHACVSGPYIHMFGAPPPDDLIDSDFQFEDVTGQLAPYQSGLLECSGNLPACRYPWSYCFGGNFSVRKRDLFDAGGWDEAFAAGMMASDTNMSYRLHRHGLRMIFSRYALAYHDWGATPMVYHPDRSSRVQCGLRHTLEQFHDPELRAYIDFRARYDQRLRLLAECARTRTFAFDRADELDSWLQHVIARPRPALSILVLAHAATLELRERLLALDCQDCSADEYEVLVYDVACPDGPTGRRPPLAADLLVQSLDVMYTLRYFAAGIPAAVPRLRDTIAEGCDTGDPSLWRRALHLTDQLPASRHVGMLQSPDLPLLLSRISWHTSFMHNSSLASRARGRYLHLLDPAQPLDAHFVARCLADAQRVCAPQCGKES